MKLEAKLDNPTEYSENRINIYRLLASIYQREPTAEILKEMKTSGLLSMLSDAGYNLNDLAETEEVKGLVAELECEFTRLFLGPGPHISPHESVHSTKDERRGPLWGEVTGEVKRFIEYYGLQYSKDFKGIPDHLSIELEFMAKLIDRELKLRSNNDYENLDHCLKVEKIFFQEHLLSWVAKFCDEVIMNAELPFYREISKFLKDFINSEKDFFRRFKQAEVK